MGRPGTSPRPGKRGRRADWCPFRRDRSRDAVRDPDRRRHERVRQTDPHAALPVQGKRAEARESRASRPRRLMERALDDCAPCTRTRRPAALAWRCDGRRRDAAARRAGQRRHEAVGVAALHAALRLARRVPARRAFRARSGRGRSTADAGLCCRHTRRRDLATAMRRNRPALRVSFDATTSGWTVAAS